MFISRLIPLAATLLLLMSTAPAPAPAQTADAGNMVRSIEKSEERSTRLRVRIADDLATDRKIVLDEAALLEKELERVLPLEAPERKDFYRTVVGRYRDYADHIFEAQAALADPADNKRRAGKEILQALQRLEERNAAFGQMLREVERKAEKEADRVARVIERRNLLLDILQDLQERRDRLETRRHDREERHEDEKERVRLKKEIELRQLDLLSLGAADEDLLRHHLLVVERMRGEAEWLEAKRDEYEALRDAVQAVLSTPGDESREFRSLAAWYDRGALRLQRKAEVIEQKNADISPSGTLRQLDRSREMQEAYASLRERWLEQAERYRLRSGDYATEAELAGRETAPPK